MSALVQYLNFLKQSSGKNEKKEKSAELKGYEPSVAGVLPETDSSEEKPISERALVNSKASHNINNINTPAAVAHTSAEIPAVTTAVHNPSRGNNAGVPRPLTPKKFTSIPRVLENLPKTNTMEDPRNGTLLDKRSSVKFARNTGIADVDGKIYVNGDDVELLGKLGFDYSCEEYLGLEKTSEVLDVYSYVEKVAGVPKEVAKLVDNKKAFSAEYLKDMGYGVPKGYEVKGDLVCPIEKKASKERVRVVLPYENQYLLEKLMNPKWPDNYGKRRFPGGGIDEGETPAQAASREFMEELGINASPDKFEYMGLDPASGNHYLKLMEHGLTPGKYKASVGSDPYIYLEQGLPEGLDYLGADIGKFAPVEKTEQSFQQTGKEEKESSEKTANNNLTLSGTPNLETTATTINPPTANIGTGPQREAIQKGTDNLARGVVSETLPLAFGGVARKALALGGNAAKINRGAELVKQFGNFQAYENSEKDTVDKMLFTAGALPLPLPAELAVAGASLGKNIYDASKVYRDNLEFRPPGGSGNNQTFSTPFKPTPPNVPSINNNNIMLAQQNLKKQSAALVVSGIHGDEPAGNIAAKKLDGKVDAVTDINPTKERKFEGKDINRHFDKPSAGRVQKRLIDLIEAKKPSSVISLHEDDEIDKSYAYSSETMADKVKKALRGKRVASSAHGDTTDAGVITRGKNPPEGSLEKALDKRDIPHATIETPSKSESVSNRVKTHLDIVEDLLSKESSEKTANDQHKLIHYSTDQFEKLRPLTYAELLKDRTSGRWEKEPDKAKKYVEERKSLENYLRKRLKQKGILHDKNKTFLYATLDGREQYAQPNRIKHEAPLTPEIINQSFFDVVGLPSRTMFGQKGLDSAIRRWDKNKDNLKTEEYMGMTIRPRIEIMTPAEIATQFAKTAAADPAQTILITGHSGAGKSTLSKQLAEKLNIPLHRVDAQTSWDDLRAHFEKNPELERKALTPGTAENKQYIKDVRKIVHKALKEIAGPAVLEGTQLTTLPAKQLAKYKANILVGGDINQSIAQRLQRMTDKAAKKGITLSPEQLAKKREESQLVAGSWHPGMEKFRKLPGVLSYNHTEHQIDPLVEQLKQLMGKKAEYKWYKSKDLHRDVTNGRHYPFSFLTGEAKELVDAIKNRDMANFKEEIGDTSYAAQMLAAQATGLNHPVYADLSKFHKREKVWKDMFKEKGGVYHPKYMEGGSNFAKPSKIIKAFASAGIKVNQREAERLANKYTGGKMEKEAAADVQLKSSNIDSVGHDKKTKLLEVLFRNGAQYEYKDVPRGIYSRLIKAKSPGKFFNKHIKRDNRFEYSKINKE